MPGKSSSDGTLFASVDPNRTVRFGPNREVLALNRQVGFTPNSGHGLAPRKLTLCARCGHKDKVIGFNRRQLDPRHIDDNDPLHYTAHMTSSPKSN